MENNGANSGSAWLEVVKRHVESLRFGAVEIIVHDARVIQIERTERVRFDKPADSAVRTTSSKEASAS